MLVVLLAGAAGCRSGRQETVFDGLVMGTYYQIKVVTGAGLSGDQNEEIRTAIWQELERINRQMSTYEPDSEISRLNRFASTTDLFPLSEEILEVFRISRQVSEKTAGAFDVTVGPLVDAWGFGPAEPTAATERDAAIEALLPFVGYDRLEIESGGVRKLNPLVRADLSGVAKGYGVDRVAGVLDGLGFSDYLVDIGGEIRVRGLNRQGRPWRIGIETPGPGRQSVYRVVALRDQAMATSGDYRNYLESDGERLPHILDPRTGHPVQNRIASVSVIHDWCAVADAYATGLMVLGAEAALQVAERENLAVFLILRTDPDKFEERASSTFPLEDVE